MWGLWEACLVLMLALVQIAQLKSMFEGTRYSLPPADRALVDSLAPSWLALQRSAVLLDLRPERAAVRAVAARRLQAQTQTGRCLLGLSHAQQVERDILEKYRKNISFLGPAATKIISQRTQRCQTNSHSPASRCLPQRSRSLSLSRTCTTGNNPFFRS
jgi:hypothetical protein